MASPQGTSAHGEPDMESGTHVSRVRVGDGERPVVGKSEPGASFEVETSPPPAEDKGEPSISPAVVAALVVGHSLSASSLVVVNKWALKGFPFLWTLTTMQFCFAALVAFVGGKLGVMQVDEIDWQKLVAFFPAAGMFFITITAGNAVLQTSNVDTFIVMRSVVPIPCALLETAALNEPYPAPKSWGGLGMIIIGAFFYASSNKGMLMQSASWVLLYIVMMPVDAVLIKHLIGSTGFTPWGMVLYNNLCGALPGIFFSLTMELNDPAAIKQMIAAASETANFVPMVLTCFMGISVSFFQLNIRKVISSTSFMVLGVSNKLITVLINQLSLDANREASSLFSVLLSIAGAVVFQQTVKGGGISQAPKPKPKAGQGSSKACIAVCVALLWSAWITAHSPKGHKGH